MEAIRSLVQGCLPPVGRRINHAGSSSLQDLPVFDGYASYWVDSGTSALALALLLAKDQQKNILHGEVILPGYCCPDLLAAVHYAGLRAVLVDVNENDPSLNMSAVRAAINSNTLAIVAVNFLGVAEQLAQLALLKHEYPALLLIEDNAQWFPVKNEWPLLVGDFVIFSFGRGKPLSLLGGGLLLSKTKISSPLIDSVVMPKPAQSLVNRFTLKAKFIAYNQLLSPWCYQLLSRNPFIALGQTAYHPLLQLTFLDDYRASLWNANYQEYAQSETMAAAEYDAIFARIGFENQFPVADLVRRRRLLRYPVLFSSVEEKERVYARLLRFGLGATGLYKTALPQVCGVENIFLINPLDNAHSFAQRFITLPTHAWVTPAHLLLVEKAFSI